MIGDAEQATYYRGRLSQMMKQVPPSVLNGSYQRSVQYKDAIEHARKALKYSDRVYLMSRGRIRMEMSSAEAMARLDEIEESYLAGTAESEEDHIERMRRKDVRRAWGRQRVRERELRRLTGDQVSRRRPAEDHEILDKEQLRRDWQMRIRRGRRY